MTHRLNPKNLNKDNLLFRQGKPDYSKLDSAAFPVPTEPEEQGAILEVTDTGDRYRWTGTDWIKIESDAISIPRDFLIEVAKGNVPGHSLIKKFGENPDIDTADGFADIWAGNNVVGGTQKAVAPTVARIHDFASSDIADAGTLVDSGIATGGSLNTLEDTGATFITDGVAVGDLVLNDTETVLGSVISLTETILTVNAFFNPNTGVREISTEAGDAYRIVTPASTGATVLHCTGLSATFQLQEKFLILNGTTNVPSLSTVTRINRLRVFGAGSAASLVGNVTATAQVDGTITANIIGNDNQTMQAIFTVPVGFTVFLLSWSGSVSRKISGVANMRIRTGQMNEIMFVLDSESVTSTGSSKFTENLGNQMIPAGTDILVEADVDTNNMGVSGGFLMLLVENGF